MKFSLLYPPINVLENSNNSASLIGYGAIQIRSAGHMHITEIRPSNADGNISSLGFVPTASVLSDSLAMVLTAPIGPSESRTFDVVLIADADAVSLTSVPIFAASVLRTDESDLLTSMAGSTTGAEEVWNSMTAEWPYAERPFFSMVDKAGFSKKIDPVTISVVVLAVGSALLTYAILAYEGQSEVEIILENDKRDALADALAILRDGDKRNLGSPDEQDLASKFDGYQSSGTNMSAGVTSSFDPNEKAGPTGVGPEGFVSALGRTTYKIFFENKAEATAAAYQIVIDDTLSSVFDPTTFEVEGSSHEGWTVTRIGNHLHWEIQGIELPPNVTPPEGEGYVQFSVEPIGGLPSGTSLENHATIVFDFNDPIVTNTFVNTLDFGKPTTTMQALEQTVSTDSIWVYWESSDPTGESGIRSTTLYQSIDGAAFTAISTSYSDSARVDVEPGHEYSFYAISRDRVGNVEQQRPAVVTTQVVSGVATEEETLPFVFALESNYPNPFNPVTTIRYSLPTHGGVRLNVYEVTGRHVAELINGEMPAGRHSVTRNARQVSSGVYFYRLEQAGQIVTRSMILLK
ncbi:MAG: T9SS type A sorting domain-containing protein [Bacteroidetes bacterium]|nr:T9SS type A sorting domain-containing protein [Bacteroidota bacterium]MDA1333146.1 T9SS type A sorting domain-containing protein [Bacteroidota bacterium]